MFGSAQPSPSPPHAPTIPPTGGQGQINLVVGRQNLGTFAVLASLPLLPLSSICFPFELKLALGLWSFPVDEKPIFPFFVDWAFGGSQSTKNRFFRFCRLGPSRGCIKAATKQFFVDWDCRLGWVVFSFVDWTCWILFPIPRPPCAQENVARHSL